MAKELRVLGVDPGFSSIGLARTTIGETGLVSVNQVSLLKTKKDNRKGTTSSEDNFNRCQLLAEYLRLELNAFNPHLICTEAYSPHRNASSAAKVGMFWGVLACTTRMLNIPLIEVSPQDLKFKITGKKTASKEEVQAAIKASFSDAGKLSLSYYAKGKHEHLFDAAGAVFGCLDHPTLRVFLLRQ